MARPRKPQTLEENLKQIDLRIRHNEEEHQSLLDEKKKLVAQIEVQEFKMLREFLSMNGMTVHDLISKMNTNHPETSNMMPVPSSADLPESMLTH